MVNNDIFLTIIVPFYNEEATITECARRVLSSIYPYPIEVIFVNDGSTDSSLQSINSIQNDTRVIVASLPKNSGKGAAIKEGIKLSKGKFILFQDADLEYDPNDIPKLTEPLNSGNFDAVFGNRFHSNPPPTTRFHLLQNRCVTILSNLTSGIKLRDAATCYKVIRSDILKAMNLRSNNFSLEAEVIAYLAKAKARLTEVNISYTPRSREEGKKLTLIDGLNFAADTIYFNCFVSSSKAFNKKP